MEDPEPPSPVATPERHQRPATAALEEPPATPSAVIRDYDREPAPLHAPVPLAVPTPLPTDPDAFESIELAVDESELEAQPPAQHEAPEVLEDPVPEMATPALSETATSTPGESVDTAPSASDDVVSPPVNALEPPPSPTAVRSASDAKAAEQSVEISKRRPSALAGIISMTRQRDLPPKPKDEEARHLRELDEMRTASKDLEKRRKEKAELESQARAATLTLALKSWETSILPNWRAALRPDAEGKALRALWWQGTMPVRWRGRLWGMAVGNGLTLSGKAAFAKFLDKAKRGIEEGTLSSEVVDALDRDIEITLPLLKLFQRDGVMHEDLKNVLLAYCVFNEGKPRYPQGISHLAALFLINMTPPEAFLSLVNLVSKSVLSSFYKEAPQERDAFYRIFDTLLADTMPRVYENFSREQVSPALYLDPWLSSCFIRFLPLDLATRLFDVFLLEGDSFLFQVSLVVLEVLEPRLFNPVREELEAVFRGTDRGAVSVLRRDTGRTEEEDVQVEAVFSAMGCKEDVIFSLLDKLEWKEETWERLVTRELPEAD